MLPARITALLAAFAVSIAVFSGAGPPDSAADRAAGAPPAYQASGEEHAPDCGCCPDGCSDCGAPCCAFSTALASAVAPVQGNPPAMTLPNAAVPAPQDPDRPHLDPPPRS